MFEKGLLSFLSYSTESYMDKNPNPTRTVCHFSRLGLKEVKLLGRYEYNTSQPPLQRDKHKDLIEIIYLARGKQIFETEGVKRFLFGSDALVILPDQPHSTAGQPEEKGLLYWLQIPINKKNQIFCPRLIDGQKLIKRLLNAKHQHFKVPESLNEYLDAAIGNFKNGDIHTKRMMVAHYIMSFLLKVVEAAEEFEPYLQSDKILDSIQYIHEHLYDPLSVPELAVIANLSVSRFKARFKEETGFPPAEYVLRRKLEQGKKLLSQNKDSITNIAINLGFSSSQYFATVFQRYTTLTPSEFRGKRS
ncbi:MAG: AraC family transcriptional regulator [Verrucomicrobiota bacterium]|nr:AraC family transcriptional regulator [Verrucomicrobiota bacterium]